MAMYWPEQKVALDIVDDPYAEHVSLNDLPADWKLLEVTIAQLRDLEGMRQIGDNLCELLGVEPPEKTPEWLEANERLFNSLNPRRF